MSLPTASFTPAVHPRCLKRAAPAAVECPSANGAVNLFAEEEGTEGISLKRLGASTTLSGIPGGPPESASHSGRSPAPPRSDHSIVESTRRLPHTAFPRRLGTEGISSERPGAATTVRGIHTGPTPADPSSTKRKGQGRIQPILTLPNLTWPNPTQPSLT